jgi:exopolyphosphatase / guanosine-5'-triphosphate,3'-diphosphate pyrophosphatase
VADASGDTRDRGGEPSQGRLSGRGPIAVIDIGSNSVRLVIYERLSRSPTMLFNEKVLAGLGKGVGASGKLNEGSVREALAALTRFRQLIAQSGTTETYVLATAAARDAKNGPSFLADVERLTGVPVRLLSGHEEALLSAYGIISGIYRPDGVAGDLGGGSLELVDIRGETIGEGKTYPLGGLRLSEAAEGNIKRAEKIAQDLLETSDVLRTVEGRDFYAVGGTWRSLARLHMFQTNYPLHVMHQYEITAGDAIDFCRTVARGDLETLPRIEVVSKARRALLPFGAAVLEQILRIGRPKRVVLSALGVREGHLYDLLSPQERAEDPLIAAAAELNTLRARSPAHGRELVPWTAQVFQALNVDETDNEARLREAACHLADIGWRAHPDYRGEQSLNIISNASFVGVDHPGRAYLALANYYRHVGLIEDALGPGISRLASTRLKDRAKLLGAAFRVAYILSAAMPGIIGRIPVVNRGGRIVLSLPRDLAALDGDRVQRRLKQLAKLGGLDATVEVVG